MKAINHKEEDKTKAAILSVLLHAALLALLFFWTRTMESPIVEAPAIVLDWGGGGGNAAAGTPDAGQGDNPADQGQQLDEPDITEPAEEPAPQPEPPAPSNPSSSESAPKKFQTSTDPDAAAIRKAQEEAKKKQQAEAAEKRRQQEEAERERQRIAQEEAERKRKEQEEYNKKKGAFGGAFGSGSGSGSGNTGKPGNQGQAGGTGNNPFGGSSGSGGGTGGGVGDGTGFSIGGGLGGRKIVGRPRMADDSQKVGTVVIEICVDSGGSVTNADYTLKGSTTNDSELRNKALQWARQFKFASSSNPKECGTVAFRFVLQ